MVHQAFCAAVQRMCWTFVGTFVMSQPWVEIDLLSFDLNVAHKLLLQHFLYLVTTRNVLS